MNRVLGENELDKKRRGRRTIRDSPLRGTRDHLFSLLDANWAEVGWQLQKLARSSDVPAALQTLPPDDYYVLKVLRRPAEPMAVTLIDLNGLDRRLEELKTKVRVIADSIEERRKMLAKLDRMLTGEMAERDRESVTDDRNEILEQLETDRSRHGALIMETNKRKAELEYARASFSQMQLLNWRKSARSRLNPRRAANAIAGLPFMSWRQSASRCVKLELSRALGQYRYQIFKIFRRIVKSWDRSRASSHADVDLISRARHYLEHARPTPAYPFSELMRNWRDVKIAIEEVIQENPEPDARAYRIAAEYFRRTDKPRSELESYLADKEQLQSAKIKKRKEKTTGLSPFPPDDKP